MHHRLYLIYIIFSDGHLNHFVLISLRLARDFTNF